MKVAISTQVFSHTVSSAINLMAKSGCHQDNIKMETRSTETAEFLKFFDNDFDIVNGYGVFNTHGKVLKTGVDVMYIRANYIHTEFWYNAIKHEVGFNRFKPRFLTQDSIRTLFWAD
ncbi:hypothetical protein QE152_g31179 [Popillia japonica]|uniref:Transposable element P transposase-like GTP-binding insertion domain-containing protein n=1 Tax=Popillia japonica TaxID=7064 RepID=A0AAW1JCH4_POPJA